MAVGIFKKLNIGLIVLGIILGCGLGLTNDFYSVSGAAPVLTSTPGNLNSVLTPMYPPGTSEFVLPLYGKVAVKLTDEAGNGLAGRTITWVGQGFLAFQTSTSITDSSGVASMTAIDSSNAGLEKVITTTISFSGDNGYNASTCPLTVHFYRSLPTPTMAVTPVKTPTPRATATPRRTPTPRTPPGSPTPRRSPTPHADGHTWEVVSGSVTNITATSATIGGSIVKHVVGMDIGGPEIIMALQYWEESNPGGKITAGTIDSRVGPTTLTVTITGLKPDTSYMFQAVKASGSSPYPNGVIKSFRTLSTGTPGPGATPGNIKVQFYNQSTNATTNQIYTEFMLVNIGSSAITLSNIKLKYYYTKDGPQTQTFYCDYAAAGSGNVTGTFVTMATPKTGADTYLEIAFTSGAGSLAAGANTIILSRIAKSDWSNYTQTNDYSFNPAGKSYVDWTKVTGYVSGGLIWGVEP